MITSGGTSTYWITMRVVDTSMLSVAVHWWRKGLNDRIFQMALKGRDRPCVAVVS